ncbi:hypothetical protein GCM10023187_03510 [Nibrella viscosa]|uniref:histidine kinase n=1 Tax=Nibrella viscosa TaxID=1084524 RepID=A0ABP8JUK2_9BACT
MVTQRSFSAIEQFFQCSSDAVLIGSLQNEYGPSGFQLEYLNPVAGTLLDISLDTDGPLSLMKTHQWPALSEFIDERLGKPAGEAGLFFWHTKEGLPKALMLDVTAFDPWLVVRLRETDAEIALQQAVGRHVLETNHLNLAIFEPVRDSTGQITDFWMLDLRDARYGAFKPNGVVEPGRLLSQWNPLTKQSGLFSRYVDVIETGRPIREERYYQHLGDSYHIAASRYQGNLLLTYERTTEKHNAQKQAEHQATLLNAILQSTQDYIMVYQALRDEQGTLVDFKGELFSETLFQNTPLTREQCLSATFKALHPRMAEAFDQYAALVETGVPFRHESEAQSDSGTSWYDVSACKLLDGFLVIFKDITPRRQIQQELESKAQQLQGVFESSPHGMILLEAMRDETGEVTDFRYLLANERASRINGVPLEHLIGNTLLTLFPSSKTSGSFPQNVHALTTGSIIRKQLRLSCERMDGWYEFVSSRINDNMLVVSFTDITETKQLEERQSKLLDELKRSNENLQQFAYIASHDLQEPLRKIQSFGDVLVNQYATALGEGGTDLIQRMQGAATRMSVLIRDLLTYSRLSTQHEPYQPIPLDSLVQDVLEDLEVAVNESQTQLTMSPLPVVSANKTQLRQLLQNLIANAIKFRKPDAPSRIQITHRQVTGPELPNPLSSGLLYSEITVADEGIGFDPIYTEKIFQMFQRLHGRSQYEGTGMGLAICRKVAENHGGTITATSEPGAGSAFRVYLPVST